MHQIRSKNFHLPADSCIAGGFGHARSAEVAGTCDSLHMYAVCNLLACDRKRDECLGALAMVNFRCGGRIRTL
jgi:hypothetical protein